MNRREFLQMSAVAASMLALPALPAPLAAVVEPARADLDESLMMTVWIRNPRYIGGDAVLVGRIIQKGQPVPYTLQGTFRDSYSIACALSDDVTVMEYAQFGSTLERRLEWFDKTFRRQRPYMIRGSKEDLQLIAPRVPPEALLSHEVLRSKDGGGKNGWS